MQHSEFWYVSEVGLEAKMFKVKSFVEEYDKLWGNIFMKCTFLKKYSFRIEGLGTCNTKGICFGTSFLTLYESFFCTFRFLLLNPFKSVAQLWTTVTQVLYNIKNDRRFYSREVSDGAVDEVFPFLGWILTCWQSHQNQVTPL